MEKIDTPPSFFRLRKASFCCARVRASCGSCDELGRWWWCRLLLNRRTLAGVARMLWIDRHSVDADGAVETVEFDIPLRAAVTALAQAL